MRFLNGLADLRPYQITLLIRMFVTYRQSTYNCFSIPCKTRLNCWYQIKCGCFKIYNLTNLLKKRLLGLLSCECLVSEQAEETEKAS